LPVAWNTASISFKGRVLFRFCYPEITYEYSGSMLCILLFSITLQFRFDNLGFVMVELTPVKITYFGK
jgi:hypothetical protein